MVAKNQFLDDFFLAKFFCVAEIKVCHQFFLDQTTKSAKKLILNKTNVLKEKKKLVLAKTKFFTKKKLA